jgi:simple sugar transport system ATP-binding protein
MTTYALQNISKWFGPLRVLDDVSLAPESGTIHAIIGENGAGKSTLMKILDGMIQPDHGHVLVDRSPRLFRSPADAQRYGIGMIHQHLSLVGSLTVLENVLLGASKCPWWIRYEKEAQRLKSLANSIGLDIDPWVRVDRLPPGTRQRIELLKLLYRDMKLMILDEPTSFLSPPEIEGLLKVLLRLKSAGRTILLITHKLDEILAVADRVTVLRRGRVVADVPASNHDAATLATLMTGEARADHPRPPQSRQSAEPALEIRQLTVGHRQGILVDRVSLRVHRGEIVGLAGVSGNGQSELAEAIAGLRSGSHGQILINGTDVTRKSIADRVHLHGLGYTPAERQQQALLLNRDLATNGIVRQDPRSFSRWGILNWNRLRKNARQLILSYGIAAQGEGQLARHLSGGNQQRLVLGRELGNRPQVLVVDNPTQGLDVRAIDFLHHLFREQASRGLAVLYLSTELDQLLSVCDRIGVMYRGQLVGMLDRQSATPEALGRLMAGLDKPVQEVTP